jgi:hypothetical protein
VEVLEQALRERVVHVLPLSGGAHEELFPLADRLALVPLGADVVVAMPWGARTLAPQPRMAQIAAQLFRWASRKALPDEREYVL